MKLDFQNKPKIRRRTKFADEQEFYLCSARIELRGVRILEMMRVIMDETIIGDAIAVCSTHHGTSE